MDPFHKELFSDPELRNFIANWFLGKGKTKEERRAHFDQTVASVERVIASGIPRIAGPSTKQERLEHAERLDRGRKACIRGEGPIQGKTRRSTSTKNK